MFCPNCGGKLPDGSKFCSMCGEKLTDTTLEVAEVPVEVDTSEPVVPAIPVAIPKPDLTQLKKKISSKMIIGIAVAGVVGIVAIFGLKARFSGGGSDNA